MKPRTILLRGRLREGRGEGTPRLTKIPGSASRCFLTPKIVAKFQQLWTAVGQDEPVNGKERSGEW